MPKLKTNRGAAKRFRATKNGFKHRCANRSHHFTGKSQKRKRHLSSGTGQVCDSDMLSISRMMPGSPRKRRGTKQQKSLVQT